MKYKTGKHNSLSQLLTEEMNTETRGEIIFLYYSIMFSSLILFLRYVLQKRRKNEKAY
jgi:hypothetical protein